MNNDELVATCLDTVWYIARKYAAKSAHLEADDLLGIGLLAMAEDIESKPFVTRAYLIQSAKWRILNALGCQNKYASVESLDRPLAGVSEHNLLADVLPEAPQHRVSPYEDCEQALYDAIHRLPVEEQEYLKRSYKLEHFEVNQNPVTGRRHRKRKPERTHRSLNASAFQYLRKDEKLRSAITMY